MKALLFILLILIGCSKEPILNPDCGVIESKVTKDGICTVVYLWNDGQRDTIAWHFDIDSAVGDTVCKLLPADDLCKP